MENNIKNFDRTIEQRMNEHEVAPPFGMWNRISAELEAMPVAATVAPAATQLIPKRAMVAIIAAALVLSATLLTGYLVNTPATNGNAIAANNNTLIAATVKPVNTGAVQQTIPVKTENVKATSGIAKARVKHNNPVAGPVQSTLQAAKQVQPSAINQAVNNNLSNNNMLINNANTDVPTPIEPVAKNADDTQTYFFPPIDVNTPEKNTANETGIAKSHTDLVPAPDDDKSLHISGFSEHKAKFHPHKRRKYAYPSIIR